MSRQKSQGKLTSARTVIEPTSGNTGIGLALVCRAKGYDLVLVMPETMTLERRQILISLGAKIVLSDGAKGMNGAEDLAHELVDKDPENYFMPNQFANQANVLAHYETTGEEIWRDTNGQITHFFGGIGTTGTLMGVSKRLKEYNPNVKVIAVQPEVGTAIQGLKDLKLNTYPPSGTKNSSTKYYVNPKSADEAADFWLCRKRYLLDPALARFSILPPRRQKNSQRVFWWL